MNLNYKQKYIIYKKNTYIIHFSLKTKYLSNTELIKTNKFVQQNYTTQKKAKFFKFLIKVQNNVKLWKNRSIILNVYKNMYLLNHFLIYKKFEIKFFKIYKIFKHFFGLITILR